MATATQGSFVNRTKSIERDGSHRLKHYYDLVNKKPEQERFLYGWFKRALSV